MGAISIRNVVKRYGHGPKANQVIHGVSADISDGEFIVIVGPSGCGKSTLLRMVAGLEEINEGEISIAGRVVNDVEPADRDIAMVFQNYALYPHMSVYDNMAYGLKIAKLPKAEIEARVNKAAAILELAPYLQRTPRQLSGGQRQRVAMGRAIVRQPSAFLFDEPLSNLDAKLRAQTRLEIQKLHRELGVTSLFVTHDQVEAMTLAQRMIVMNAGRMEQIGTGGSVITLPLPMAAPHAGALVLGLRPEHTMIDPQGSWPLQVETVEMLGAERLVHGRLGAALFTLRIDATLVPPQVGDTVRLTVAADRLHWFDAATGLRVEN